MTVRVLRAGGQPAPRGPDFAPSARRLDGARYEARLEAERTIAAARATAEQLIERAREQAASIEREAERAGIERAHATTLALLQRAQLQTESGSERLHQLVVMATKAVTERALGMTLAHNDEALAGWAREALATFVGARRIELRAHPRTITRLRELRGVDVVADPELDEHTLIARTDLGDARVELRTQVQAFVDAIAEVLEREVRKHHG